MEKTLVAYFSPTGTTEKAAALLEDANGADLFAIEPKVPYTKADLIWLDKNARSTVVMQNKQSRPEIKESEFDMKNYDTIFLGFPIW